MKYKTVWRIITAVLLSAVFALPLPTTPAMAAPGITLNKTQGTMGQVISVSGSGFWGSASDETSPRGVILLFGKYPTTNGTADLYTANIYERIKVIELSSGAFSTTFTIPAFLNSGLVKEAVNRGLDLSLGEGLELEARVARGARPA